MKNYKPIHKIIAVFLTAICLAISTAAFYGKNSFAQDEAAGGGQIGGDILSILGDLGSIRLDDSVFQNPIFQSLKDYSVVIPREIKGRKNPFLPIGQDVIPTGATEKTATTTAP